MRHSFFIATSIICGLVAAPPAAVAQSSFMSDMIGQAVANSMNAGIPEACLVGDKIPSAKQQARFAERREDALKAYLALAAAGTDVAPSFTNRRYDRRWALDGTPGAFGAIRDPWAARIARVDLAGQQLGNMHVRGRALWNAFAADGQLLGTYDVLFRRTTKGYELSSLELFTPSAAQRPLPVVRFCYTPGDTEQHAEDVAKAKADRDARKAEKAARNAARAGGR